MSKTARIVILVACCLGISGCGGGPRQNTQVRTTTIGQELSDLQAAHAEGAISDREYEKMRAKILKGN
ncbi:hypothetical protein RGUI_1602 [Rhodovulum sp. P5]|uniref:SHOCT domain-containing protein n=1 Tax=Rhodovulum sp. P5 TaxID=1564506 RepID=UPI0009C214D5|nr:SHOCT domain-containing protein [Rhodovulum sp. P5]ARE39743.1 hypothetical protein RGUI_1602 [Rhodovulum sp. P5]